MKCAKCAHQWFVAGAQSEMEKFDAVMEAPEDKPQTKTSRSSKRSAGPKPPQKASPLLSGIMVASGLLAVMGSFVVSKPQWFGLKPEIAVTMSDISLAKQEVERGMEYAVSGKLINASSKPVKPPKVRITLVDKEGNPLQYWEPMLPETLEPHTPMPFTFGPLKTKFSQANRMVVELGSGIQLAMRSKP